MPQWPARSLCPRIAVGAQAVAVAVAVAVSLRVLLCGPLSAIAAGEPALPGVVARATLGCSPGPPLAVPTDGYLAAEVAALAVVGGTGDHCPAWCVAAAHGRARRRRTLTAGVLGGTAQRERLGARLRPRRHRHDASPPI